METRFLSRCSVNIGQKHDLRNIMVIPAKFRQYTSQSYIYLILYGLPVLCLPSIRIQLLSILLLACLEERKRGRDQGRKEEVVTVYGGLCTMT